MPHPIASLNGSRAADNGSAVDFSKLSFDPQEIASGKHASDKPRSSPVVRTALGPTSVALKPDEVKALATSFLPVAQKIVDSTFANYIKLAPKLQLKLWAPEQMRANYKGENTDGVIAYTDTGRPGIINVAYKSPMFNKFNVDATDLKMFLLHEVLHTRSAAFSANIGETYGKSLVDGRPATFSDGSAVRGITEGLTEIYTLMASQQKTSPSSYGRELKWAVKLIEKVGPESMAKAYFGNDVASMVQVKKAINELVAADKRAPEIPSARSH